MGRNGCVVLLAALAGRTESLYMGKSLELRVFVHNRAECLDDHEWETTRHVMYALMKLGIAILSIDIPGELVLGRADGKAVVLFHGKLFHILCTPFFMRVVRAQDERVVRRVHLGLNHFTLVVVTSINAMRSLRNHNYCHSNSILLI